MGDELWHLDGVELSGIGVSRLREVCLTFRTGSTAIIGSSGAGKTSLINLLVGYEHPRRGQLRCCLPHTNGRAAFFWVPQEYGLWPHLTVREHLSTVAARGPDEAGRVDAILEDFGLATRADVFPERISQGQKSRLAVARALAADPAVLVMDEPLAHVDLAHAAECWEAVEQHVSGRGASFVFSTHSPAAVLAHADRVICLDEGCVLYEGAVEKLYRRPDGRRLMAFLGEGNWLEVEDARFWLEQEQPEPCCYRPEQIAVDPCPDGPLLVRNSRFAGHVAYADLVHEPSGRHRSFFHRPVSDALRTGMRAVLRVLTIWLLAIAVAGCDGGLEPTLRPSNLNYWQIPRVGHFFPAPRNVTIGPQDQVLVLDNAGRVLVFDERGNLLRQWQMPKSESGHPEGVCWFKDGRIAVADTHYFRLVFFDETGNVVGMLGRRRQRNEPGAFGYPVSIVQDDHENFYVSEYADRVPRPGGGDRVQKFSRDGEFLLAFGRMGTGPGQFQRAAGMAWHEGRLYIADASNHRVQVFEDDGSFLQVLGEGELAYQYDVEVSADGSIFVIEWREGRVSKFDPQGRLAGRFGHAGRGPKQFRTPWSLALDSKMRLRVADTENRRIVELVF